MASQPTPKTALFARFHGNALQVVDQNLFPGSVYFVGSTVSGATDSTGFGKNPESPFATIDFAVGQCTASVGDAIIVLPGHVETVSTAGGLALDVAGIKVIGVGEGDLRPTVNFTGDGTVTVGAAAIHIQNLIFKCSSDGQAIMLDINKSNCKVYGCEFREGASAQPVDVIDIAGTGANECDRTKIHNCRFYFPTAGPATAIKITNVHVGIEVCDCWIEGDFSTAAISSGAAFTDALIARNVISNVNAGDWSIELTAAATGMLVDNRFYADGTTTTLDPGSMKCVNNRQVNAIDSADVAIPAPNASADTIEAALWGANGITTFPAAAIPANGVSIAEVLRQVYAALEGTAASQNGVATWPTAAAYANNVSIAEVLGYIQDAVRNGTGSGLATNESLADVLYATNGIVTFPAAAAPANGVSIAEVLRSIYNRVSYDSAASVVTTNSRLGTFVTKTEDVSQATQDDLFTVTGKVLITAIFGEVTNAIGAAVTDYQLRIKTDNIVLCAASNISSDGIGTMYSLSSDAGDVLGGQTLTTADTDGKGLADRLVGKAGGSATIEGLRTAGDAGDAIIWTLWYIPLEASASVAAAA